MSSARHDAGRRTTPRVILGCLEKVWDTDCPGFGRTEPRGSVHAGPCCRSRRCAPDMDVVRRNVKRRGAEPSASLRAKRSNPENARRRTRWQALSGLLRRFAPRNDGCCGVIPGGRADPGSRKRRAWSGFTVPWIPALRFAAAGMTREGACPSLRLSQWRRDTRAIRGSPAGTERNAPRHCERSEAIQAALATGSSPGVHWIASSLRSSQ